MGKNENEQDQIMKMIQGLNAEEREALFKKLQGEERQERKKVRRKHYKKEGQFETPPKPVEYNEFDTKKKRQNLFEKSPLFQAEARDINVDKKLWSGNQPTARDRKNDLVKVNCAGCNKASHVNRSLIYRSSSAPNETSEWYCNNCLARKARNHI